ncbi:MAG: putative bacterial extracellular solute-binding protein [Ramlibacter sp.]|nr:putative bacterial extracellular solute-binding protein [Ramlibacter sp.]
MGSATLGARGRQAAWGDRPPRPQPAREEFRVGLCVPLAGASGIWGPSAIACAELAVGELNIAHGLGGRRCRLVLVDASEAALDVGATVKGLIDAGEVDALVGMHTSLVRHRILRAAAGCVPFVYTPLYEGGETTPGVFAIGETPARTLRPAIAWTAERYRPRRWALVGNDYVWPRVSHALARRYIRESGAEVVAERYVTLGTQDFAATLDEIRRVRADAVVMSLIGQDAVDFNRAFAAAGLQRRALRLSTAVEENTLMAIGADNTEGLHVAAGYFSSLATDDNLRFKERYETRFGHRAPTLNTLGQSTYEGMYFLAQLCQDWSGGGMADPRSGGEYPSARGALYSRGGGCGAPAYLAQAQGHAFEVLTTI